MMLCLAVVSIGLTANAQTNSNHLMFGVGALYEKGLDATIAYEHGSKYHNAWEYFVTGYLQYDDDPNAGHVTKKSFWHNYNSWHLGIVYKPCVNRGRNHHGNVPNISGEVTFQADLSKERGESHFLGIRYHRAILAVHWTLTANYSSSQIVDMMELDPELSDAEKADLVNQRLHEIMNDHPGCTVEANYAYSSPAESEGDEDAVHLLWTCDRLNIARDVDYRLSKIYAQLILIEKFMRSRETMLDYLKQQLGITVLSGTDRIRIGGRSFRHWRNVASAVARGDYIVEDDED